MQITVNGEHHQFEDTLTVTHLLEKLGLDMQKIAFECNREIISRSVYDETQINDGDQIEIVHFIGGG